MILRCCLGGQERGQYCHSYLTAVLLGQTFHGMLLNERQRLRQGLLLQVPAGWGPRGPAPPWLLGVGSVGGVC